MSHLTPSTPGTLRATTTILLGIGAGLGAWPFAGTPPCADGATVDLSIEIRTEATAFDLGLPALGTEPTAFERLMSRIFVTTREGEPSKLDVRNPELPLPPDETDVDDTGSLAADAHDLAMDDAGVDLEGDREDATSAGSGGEPMSTKDLYYATAVNRAKIQFAANDLDAAYQTCNELLRVKADLAEAYVIRGAVMAKRDRHGEAIEDYNRALRIDPKLAVAYQGRGVSYQKVGRRRNALDDFTRAIEFDPDLAEAYHKRGLASAEAGDYPKALADFQKFVQLAPNDPIGYHNRGAVLKRLGREREAAADLARSRELERRLQKAR